MLSELFHSWTGILRKIISDEKRPVSGKKSILLPVSVMFSNGSIPMSAVAGVLDLIFMDVSATVFTMAKLNLAAPLGCRI